MNLFGGTVPDADVFFLVSNLLYAAVLYNDVFEAFMQWRSLQRAYKPLMWGRLYEEYLLSPFVKPENPTYVNIWPDFITVGLRHSIQSDS